MQAGHVDYRFADAPNFSRTSLMSGVTALRRRTAAAGCADLHAGDPSRGRRRNVARLGPIHRLVVASAD